ncbi:uncharacterized protein LOC125672288 [Ostrea edulis]|uniref:uncharacterized protein LOC125672288 n=1 Tax=Ostrea edulis TaxID=37623 RepID=UPI0024AF181F|nr:uncharacterized protein LOC125672288 [Ostrea edulis]
MWVILCLSVCVFNIISSSALDTQLNWVWEKAGVSRKDYESDVDNRTTTSTRTSFADFSKEKLARDLSKTERQLLKLTNDKELKCNGTSSAVPDLDAIPLPEITTKLSQNEKTSLRYLLRQMDVIKDTIRDAMKKAKTPKCLRKCKAGNRLLDTGDSYFDFTREFYLCSWMTQFENLEKVKDLRSSRDVSASAVLDILLVLTDNAAVLEYLTMEHMNDLKAFDQIKKERK